MNEIAITSAQYQTHQISETEAVNCSIKATIHGIETSVPLDPDNRHYAEILRQVEAGTLTIADAD